MQIDLRGSKGHRQCSTPRGPMGRPPGPRLWPTPARPSLSSARRLPVPMPFRSNPARAALQDNATYVRPHSEEHVCAGAPTSASNPPSRARARALCFVRRGARCAYPQARAAGRAYPFPTRPRRTPPREADAGPPCAGEFPVACGSRVSAGARAWHCTLARAGGCGGERARKTSPVRTRRTGRVVARGASGPDWNGVFHTPRSGAAPPDAGRAARVA